MQRKATVDLWDAVASGMDVPQWHHLSYKQQAAIAAAIKSARADERLVMASEGDWRNTYPDAEALQMECDRVRLLRERDGATPSIPEPPAVVRRLRSKGVKVGGDGMYVVLSLGGKDSDFVVAIYPCYAFGVDERDATAIAAWIADIINATGDEA